MKDLIKVTQNENGELLVSARNLYKGLEITDRFSRWFERMCEYGFVENEDYTGVKSSTVVNNGAIKELQDYILKIDMAKEISMIQRNEKGKQVRKYFIETEKKLKEATTKDKYISEIDVAKAEMDLLEITSKVLNLNDSSKLAIATNIYENHNIPTNQLPTYTQSKGRIRPISELLKKYYINMSAISFNKKLLEKGILKECTRKSSKGKEKKFKMLVNTEWGENLVNPKSPKETQPMYYEDKFEELIKIIL